MRTVSWLLLAASGLVATSQAAAPASPAAPTTTEDPIVVPRALQTTAGYNVTVGEPVLIPGATQPLPFQFADGRIVVRGGEKTDVWSSDGGRTWKEGPRAPATKTTLDMGDGRVFAFSSRASPRPDGLHEMAFERSTNNWATHKSEKAVVHVPEAGSLGGDDGKVSHGMVVHHGAIRLKDGGMLISMYGNYQGDTDLADGYPAEFNMRKYRTIVMSSSDDARTFGNPVTVAYGKMRARGLDNDSRVKTFRIVPAITQEGFCEPDLIRAPNGDILCMMRSGGRIAVGDAPIFATPMYLSRSSDEGKTWTTPIQVTDRGVCPYFLLLENGVIVCSYTRPGNWLIFSDDSGATWKGPIELPEGRGYSKVVAAGRDRALAIIKKGEAVFGTPVTIAKTK